MRRLYDPTYLYEVTIRTLRGEWRFEADDPTLNAAILGGPIAALDEEEGRRADAVNLATVGRSWDLWKKRVTS